MRAQGPKFERTRFATVILGAGPGGTGPLVHAAQAGTLDAWLASGVAIVDKTASFGGTIGRYVVNSDSLGGVYLECLEAPRFAPLRDDPVTAEMRAYARGFPPLPLVGHYFAQLGQILEQSVTGSSTSRFFAQSEATSLQLCRDGTVELTATSGGSTIAIRAETAVIALGGRPRSPKKVVGLEAFDLCASPKAIASDVLLRRDGLARARALLGATPGPKVAILGGAHSAYSAAWLLTELLPDVSFGHDAITLLCRSDPKIYYPTRDDARTESYSFVEEDVCPRTQRVNRMAGLRGDGRELWRRMAGRANSMERRVRTIRLDDDGAANGDALAALNEANLIVPAFGYAARTISIYDARGTRLHLRADQDSTAVDDACRIVLADGSSLPNVFGIGLGHGFRPHGEMGGEPSFRGQANSLWLYQNHVGRTVFEGVTRWLERDRSIRKLPAAAAS